MCIEDLEIQNATMITMKRKGGSSGSICRVKFWADNQQAKLNLTRVFIKSLSFKSFSWKWFTVVCWSLSMYSSFDIVNRGFMAGSCSTLFRLPPNVKQRAIPEIKEQTKTFSHRTLEQAHSLQAYWDAVTNIRLLV